MKINYKYTSIILSILLVLALIPMFSFKRHGDMRGDRFGSQKIHMMPDGTMMRENKDMAHTKMDMGDMMMAMTENMKGKTGTELEKAFIAGMIPHHQGAVDMAKLLLEDKTIRPELAKFAHDIVTAQEGEIATMNMWLKKWYGSLE